MQRERDGGDFLLLPIADTYPPDREEEAGGVRGQLTDGTWETRFETKTDKTSRI